MTRNVAVPYLTVADGAAALEFYGKALGAVEQMRVVMDDAGGALGHASFRIGDAEFYLSDEFVEMGVTAPPTIGGTTVAIHLTVEDVDGLFTRAVADGAEALQEPTDQPHGARMATLLDPFGHRWVLSQQIEPVSDEEYAARAEAANIRVLTGDDATAGATGASDGGVSGGGGIWAALNFADARAGIEFMTDVLGFVADLVVPDEHEPDIIVHSQLRWPEGGVVQAASANRDGNPYSQQPIGSGSLYVITADPTAVHGRCVEADAEIIAEPTTPEYDPTGTVFSLRDPEGNLWSFGTYRGES